MAAVTKIHLLPEWLQAPTPETWLIIQDFYTNIAYKITVENFLKADGYNGILYDKYGEELAIIVNGKITNVALAVENLESPDEQILENPTGEPLEAFVRSEL
jgi:hypothetical protein